MRLEELTKQYFYITIHFAPEYEGKMFIKFEGDLYINIKTKEIYRKRLLYDFGWGQESGFELMPQLPFDDLIKLVEQPMIFPSKKFGILSQYTKEDLRQADIWRNNLYGAVSVIMQDYVEDLIEFLSVKVNTDYFSSPSIRENFKHFSFDSQKTRVDGKIPGGILTRSYEEVLRGYPQWERISSEVIHQVYR